MSLATPTTRSHWSLSWKAPAEWILARPILGDHLFVDYRDQSSGFVIGAIELAAV